MHSAVSKLFDGLGWLFPDPLLEGIVTTEEEPEGLYGRHLVPEKSPCASRNLLSV